MHMEAMSLTPTTFFKSEIIILSLPLSPVSPESATDTAGPAMSSSSRKGIVVVREWGKRVEIGSER
jgi:hypothetical protein